MKNKKVLVILTAIVLLLGIISSATYYWYIGTPEYSLKQLRSAYTSHNTEKALKYVDIDSIFDNFWSEFQKKNAETLTSSTNGFEQLGYLLGQGMIEGMKPTLKQKMRDAIVDSIKSNSSTATSTSKYDELSLINKYSLTRLSDSIAILQVQDQKLKFELNKTTKRYWKIVAIEGLMDDEATTATSTEFK